MPFVWQRVKDALPLLITGIVIGLLFAFLILFLNRPTVGTPITLQPPPASVTPVPVRVHVIGAVNNPGLYELSQNSVAQDAIEAAGGPTALADLSKLNLAGILVDGQQLVIPERVPTVGPGTPSPEPPPLTGSHLNINLATAEQLDTLPGIGPAIAQRIIDYRTTNGPFNSIDELLNIEGIGEGTFEELKDLIAVN
jgi:competence protein ComEA